MNLEKILSTAKQNKYSIINNEELEKLLSESETIIEKDTHISDKIRLLKLDGDLIIQEKTTKDELLIRIVKTKKEGEDLIEQRLEIYDKMWDGCGCKVDYYE